jgi:hypothetical protein
MTIAPLELVMIAFPGSKFSGEIIPVLGDLVERGHIRIVDLVFMQKMTDELPTIMELENVKDEYPGLVDIVGDVNGLISEEDIVDLAVSLDKGDSAAILLFEHTWASAFTDAVRRADGELVFSLRIPQAVVDEVEAARAEVGRK